MLLISKHVKTNTHKQYAANDRVWIGLFPLTKVTESELQDGSEREKSGTVAVMYATPTIPTFCMWSVYQSSIKSTAMWLMWEKFNIALQRK